MAKKTNAAVAEIAEAAPPTEPEPEGKIPLSFHALYQPAKRALPLSGRTCYADEIPPENALQEPRWRVFDIPLEDGGRVTEIFNVERWARSHGLLGSNEKCVGPGFEH